MTDEEKKILFEYLKSIQENVDEILEEKTEDDRKQTEKYNELMLAVSKLTTEFHLVLGEQEKMIKTVKKTSNDTQEVVVEGVGRIDQTLSTKKVVKSVIPDPPSKWQKFLNKFKRGVSV